MRTLTEDIFQEYRIDTEELLCLKTKAKQLEAVKQDGCALQFIHNPTKEIQLEAIK